MRTAGHAEALGPAGTPGSGVGLPMLLAVLMLAGVTAALVRTWVLRRVRVVLTRAVTIDGLLTQRPLLPWRVHGRLAHRR